MNTNEEFVEEVFLSPSERVIVDVLFERARRSSFCAGVANWRRCGPPSRAKQNASPIRRWNWWPRCPAWHTWSIT